MPIIPTNPISMGARLKILRTDYKLTMQQLSELLGFKGGKSSISNIEAGRNNISLDILNQYIILFGVSTDWIYGLNNIQYQEWSVKYAEDESPSIPSTLLGTPLSEPPKEYLNYHLRKNNYSLYVRANLVFMRNIIAHSDNTTIVPATKTVFMYLASLLNKTRQSPIYSFWPYQLEQIIPAIIDSFNKLGIIAEPAFRAVKIVSVLDYPCNYEMTTEDIIFFCMEHYDIVAGSACFFIEKIYRDLYEKSEKECLMDRLIALSKLEIAAYKLRDAFDPRKKRTRDKIFYDSP